jgi:hypothetical protein
MDWGLAKLVPVDINQSGGFKSNGISITWDEYNDKTITEHYIYVYLKVFINYSDKVSPYQAVLGVSDHDDSLLQIWKPLNEENWIELHKIYEDLCIPEMLTTKNLISLGFT